MNHLDDDAELYALGMIGNERVAEIEAHLAQCGNCRACVVAAESAAASLAGALPAMPRDVAPVAPRAQPAWFTPVAAAAALLFAATAAFEGSAAHTASARSAQTDTALVALASSHFAHTSLSAEPGIVAKAIYARDGAWCFVVAENVPDGARLRMYRGGAAHDLGALASGSPATLFVRGAGHVERIEIVAGGRTVARGTPAY